MSLICSVVGHNWVINGTVCKVCTRCNKVVMVENEKTGNDNDDSDSL